MTSSQRLISAFLLAAALAHLVSAGDQRLDVSQIIGKTEAAAILGEPIKDPSPRNGTGADGYYSKCSYYSVRGGKSLVIRFQLPGPNAINPQKELELLVAANGSGKKISGLGDAAQTSVESSDAGLASRILMLYVVKGNAFLTIGLGGFTDDSGALERAKAVAQELLAHL